MDQPSPTSRRHNPPTTRPDATHPTQRPGLHHPLRTPQRQRIDQRQVQEHPPPPTRRQPRMETPTPRPHRLVTPHQHLRLEPTQIHVADGEKRLARQPTDLAQTTHQLLNYHLAVNGERSCRVAPSWRRWPTRRVPQHPPIELAVIGRQGHSPSPDQKALLRIQHNVANSLPDEVVLPYYHGINRRTLAHGSRLCHPCSHE